MNLILVIALFSLASFIIGGLLGFASEKLKVEGNPAADEIDNVLPQTQCGQCGYAGCRQYAEAVASGKAEINLCVPGGQRTVNELARIMNVPAVSMGGEEEGPQTAFITENLCIGCHKCAANCPVQCINEEDTKYVIDPEQCIECGTCNGVCPVGAPNPEND